jgi:hypothetical protein
MGLRLGQVALRRNCRVRVVHWQSMLEHWPRLDHPSENPAIRVRVHSQLIGPSTTSQANHTSRAPSYVRPRIARPCIWDCILVAISDQVSAHIVYATTLSSLVTSQAQAGFSESCICDPRPGSLCKALTSLHRSVGRGISFSSSHHTS